MGANKRHYYIKKKLKASPENVSFSYDKPQVIFQPVFSSRSTQSSERVLDLDFKVTEHPRLWWGMLRWGLLILIAVLIYVTGSLLNLGGEYIKNDIVRKGEVAAINLQKGMEALAKIDMDNALRNFRLAERNFNSASISFTSLGQRHIFSAGLPFDRSQLFQAQVIISSGHHLATAGVNITRAFKPLIQYWDGVTTVGKDLQDVGYEVGRLLLDSSQYIDKALSEVVLADNMLELMNPNYIPLAYVSLVGEAQDKTQKFRQALEMTGIIAQRLPIAIGFNNPRYYLLLNQNSNEARATGGFIGSYVFLELYKGRLENIFVDDIHRLDGQNLHSDMQLPIPLRAVTSYYGVRDANWEPNFPTSVRTIQRLYEQAGGGTVDGMVALTPTVVSDILSVLGPIYMPKYNINITAGNFVAKTQKQTELDSQSAYNHKQLLVDLAPIIINRLLNASTTQISLIGEKLLKRLITKDILLNFSDSQLESVISALGWGGEIQEILPQDDYLYIVESNLGGNKSSGSIVRQITHRAVVSSHGAVLNDLKIVYTHEGVSEFPDGINKNYIRIYLPLGTRISKTSGYDSGTQIDVDTSDGKTMLGFWVTTKPGEVSTIELEYLLPFRLSFSQGLAQYRLIIQRQPGIRRTLFQSQIKVAKNMSLAGNRSQNNKDLFLDQLVKDELITTSIYKQ